MSEAEEVKLHVKVVTNKEKTKVLFAEAGSDFTDVLLSFLLLPLGTIVEVIEKHYGDKAPAIGSLNTLYKGAANLDIIHFEGESDKKKLFNSTTFEDKFCELRLNVSCTHPTSSSPGKSYDGVFTNRAASFIISDDLCVLPNVAGSIMETLSSLGIAVTDIDGAETMNVTFGFDEIMALLKESLISSNPLSAIIFPGRQILATEGTILLHQIDQNVISMNPNKITLKLMLQKSTNNLLYAQTDYDFVDFIFGMLTIFLGKVEWFLGSNAGLKSMDNLHRSVADNIKGMHLKSYDTKNLLINQKPKKRGSQNEFSELNFSSSITTNHFVNCVRMYMVSDDLTVAPLGVISGLSVINKLKISLSDVKEMELQVGLEEGLSILKAALTSTTALTDGLIKPFLKEKAHSEMEERPKLEC